LPDDLLQIGQARARPVAKAQVTIGLQNRIIHDANPALNGAAALDGARAMRRIAPS
jgi:hypothetical protein